jgi:predicted transcriptional regulator of viral defense system
MRETRAQRPEWDRLYEVAASQDGYLTARQAQDAGYSLPLLTHHIKRGRLLRVRRGILRLKHYPPGEHEDLVVLWLWSEQAGVFSHETALALHGLSDALPSVYHLTLPASWAHRRLRVPPGVRLEYSDLPKSERTWRGVIPLTTPLRTFADCVRAGANPEFLAAARRQLLRRGLTTKEALQARLREVRGAAKGTAA